MNLRNLFSLLFCLFFISACGKESSSKSNNTQGNNPETPAAPEIPVEKPIENPEAKFPPKVQINREITKPSEVRKYRDAVILTLKENNDLKCIPGAAAALAGFYFNLEREFQSINTVGLGNYDNGLKNGSLITLFEDRKTEGEELYRWYLQINDEMKTVESVFYNVLQWKKVNEGTIENPRYVFKYVSAGVGKCDPAWYPNSPKQ